MRESKKVQNFQNLLVFSRRFQRKTTTLTVASFVSSTRSIHFLCTLVCTSSKTWNRNLIGLGDSSYRRTPPVMAFKIKWLPTIAKYSSTVRIIAIIIRETASPADNKHDYKIGLPFPNIQDFVHI